MEIKGLPSWLTVLLSFAATYCLVHVLRARIFDSQEHMQVKHSKLASLAGDDLSSSAAEPEANAQKVPIKTKINAKPTYLEEPEDFDERNALRIKRLKQTCQKIANSSEYWMATKVSEFSQNLVFRKRFTMDKFSHDNSRFREGWKYARAWAMCLPPKHGTTNWQRMLIAGMKNKSPADVKWDDKMYHTIPSLGLSRDLDDIAWAIEDAPIKILLARNPFDKLYSAWADKFRKNNRHFKSFRNYLKFIPNKYAHLTPTNHSCSFPDFITYWLHEPTDARFNVHWKSQMYMCLPCSVDYTYVVKTETSDMDSVKIMEKLYPNSHNARLLPKYDKSAKRFENNTDLAKSVHGWLPDDLLEKLRQRFRWENELFGYSF